MTTETQTELTGVEAWEAMNESDKQRWIEDNIIKCDVYCNVNTLAEFYLASEDNYQDQEEFYYSSGSYQYEDHAGQWQEVEFQERDQVKEKLEEQIYGLEESISDLEDELEGAESKECELDDEHQDAIDEHGKDSPIVARIAQRLRDKRKHIQDIKDDIESESKDLENAQHDLEALDAAEPDYSEIFEYWAVSSWLGNKLKEHGEPVIEIGLTTVWGRCTTGQAILLDGVMRTIAKELAPYRL